MTTPPSKSNSATEVCWTDLTVLEKLSDPHPMTQLYWKTRTIYHYQYYLCFHQKTGEYYLWTDCDRYENGQYEETEPSGGGCERISPAILQFTRAFFLKEAMEKEQDCLEFNSAILGDIRRKLESYKNMMYYSDLASDIRELDVCFDAGANRAVLALAGRILETSLKTYLRLSGGRVEKDWMIGKLLKQMDEASIYVDPALRNVENIINMHRIVGVHTKELVPIPSRHQTQMVCHATMDLLERLLARLSNASDTEKERISSTEVNPGF